MAIIQMILLISFLVLVHEVGHFMSARLLGMKVSKFGFGLPIGPTLWSKKIGDVEVLVHAFLLGGYVSFPDDEKDSDLPKDSKERFTNKPVWQRMIVISAGVIANIIAAFFLVLVAALIWGKLPTGEYKVTIAEVVKDAKYSVADSGMQPKDIIYSINGQTVNPHYALGLFATGSKKNDGLISQNDLDKTLDNLKSLNPKLNSDDVIENGTIIYLPNKVAETILDIEEDVLKGVKPYKETRLKLTEAQTKLRDVIVESKTIKADGTITLTDVAYAITDYKQPLNIVVLRGKDKVELKPIYPAGDGLIGIKQTTERVVQPINNLGTAITSSYKYLYDQTALMISALAMLFTGKVPVSDLHGIVLITKLGGDVIQNAGLFSGLLLTAQISMNLALVNFLPIPALDGGHFMFLIIEKLRGKPLDEEAINKISTFFFMLLLVFMVLVIFNDIYALVKHKF